MYASPGCTGANTEQWDETKLDSGRYRAIGNLNDIGWYHKVRSFKFKTGLTSSPKAAPVRAAVDLNCGSGQVCLFDWVNCDDGGGRFAIDLGLHQAVPNMGIWFERVSSIRIQ